MKATIAEITPRLTVRENRQEGIQNFDIDNAYPQRIRHAVKSSGRATQCTNILKKFIRAYGFDDVFYKTVINKKRMTVDALHRKLVEDYVLFRGFAMHLNFNMLGEIISIDHVPFEELRLGLEDENGIVRKVKHHIDWARETGRYFKKDKITEFDLYNPDINALLMQADAAGGFQNYKGQIYYYSANGLNYPEAWCDPILEDVISDNEAKLFRLNNISTSYLASHYVEVEEFEDEDEREAFTENLKNFQGAKKAGKFLLIEKKGADSPITINKVDVQNIDDLFSHTEESTLESIRRLYMVLPVLLGDLIAGKLATANEIEDAYTFTNSITQDDRLVFEEVFTEIFSRWHVKAENRNYSIKPLKYIQETAAATTKKPDGNAPVN